MTEKYKVMVVEDEPLCRERFIKAVDQRDELYFLQGAGDRTRTHTLGKVLFFQS